MMNRLLIVVAFLTIYWNVNGQEKIITGRLLDSINNPIENVNIKFSKVESNNQHVFIAGTTSNMQGNFQIDVNTPGTFILEFNHINYYNFLEFMVLDETEINLGEILLTNKLNQLDEVVISGKTIPIIQTADKITINVSENLLGTGGTPVDVLKQIPIVSVSTEGNISIRGKGDIQILIDGKPSGFAALQGQRFLDQLDLSTIHKIEVLTNPSVIQSSSGSGGVINIIKKKNDALGLSGRINGGVGSDEWYHLSTGISYGFKDVNLFLSYSLRNRKRLANNLTTKEQQLNDTLQIITESQSGIRDDFRQNIEAGIDYYIDSSNYLTLSGNYRNRDKKDKQNRITTVQESGELIESRNGLIKEPETNEGWGSSLMYVSKKSENNNLNLILDYVHSVEKEDIFREEVVTLEDAETVVGIQSFYTDINDRIFFDFEKKRLLNEKFELVYGFQSVYRDINQNFNAMSFDETTATYLDIPSLNDRFNYSDIIGSAYVQIENSRNKLSYEFALRFEYLSNTYNSESVSKYFKDDYFSFLPSVKLTYPFSEATTSVFSLKKGINRPAPNRLNPFPDVSNAFNISVGNPELRPEIFYNIEYGVNTKINNIKINSSLFLTVYNDLIQRITQLQENGITLRFPTNIDRMLHYGLDFNVQLNLTKWWTQDVGGMYFNRSFKDDLIENSNNSSYQMKSNSVFEISDRLSFQLFGSYKGPEYTPQGKIKSQHYFDGGLEYESSNRKSRISLTMTDIFNSLQEVTRLMNEDLIANTNQKLNTRRVYLSFNYRF